MYIKRRRNASGSVSIQIIEKKRGKSRLVKTMGSSSDETQIREMECAGQAFIDHARGQLDLGLLSSDDFAIKSLLLGSEAPIVKAVGPELVLGTVFDAIGFSQIEEPLFRHLVLARLTYPVSKLKTTEYLSQHHQETIAISSVYRFLDRFHRTHKGKVEEIAFEHSRKALGGKLAVVFYDMTTLYFEAEDEDDLRRIGFSKDGKFQNPQIMLGLFVGENGYPIAYDIYEGNTFEGHTLISALESVQKRFGIEKPMVVADSALLTKSNIENLITRGYLFIVGARIKNESVAIKGEILNKASGMKHGDLFTLEVSDNHRLIVSYSDARAKKDAANRSQGITRLEDRIKTGRLTKKVLLNRGYNKFLKVESEAQISIDQSKISEDAKWDGLKGYVTNSPLPPEQVIANYNHLWTIERAFRISKTDLRIRPIFHRKKDRIEAHVCIAFVAYSVFKELERCLDLAGSGISPQRAIELSKTIFEIKLSLPDSRKEITALGRLTDKQRLLLTCLKRKN
jgi:hypothetical protein